MTIKQTLQKIGANEDLNFLLTNRIPRLALTRFMGWFSQRRTPWVRDLSIATWKRIADLDLSEAKNLAAAQPEVVRRLSDELDRWNKQLIDPLFASPQGTKAADKKAKK